MIRALTKLRWYDYLIVALGLALALSLGATDPKVALFPRGGVPTQSDPPVMSDAAAKAYRQHFAGAGYFGAFAIADDGAFGWTVSHSSLKAARMNALAYCEERGSGCRVVSELVPEGYVEGGDAVTLRHRDAIGFQKYMRQPGAKAFAIAENGTFGMVHGRATVWAARAGALARCRSQVQENQPGFLPDWPCRVIHSSWR